MIKSEPFCCGTEVWGDSIAVVAVVGVVGVVVGVVASVAGIAVVVVIVVVGVESDVGVLICSADVGDVASESGGMGGNDDAWILPRLRVATSC